MSVEAKDVVLVSLSDDEIREAILFAEKISKHIVDRKDLHNRDGLERFINILTGEIAEKMVLRWFADNNKYAQSAIDKDADTPDSGHDIWLRDLKNNPIQASVKSSISVLKNSSQDILNTFTLASKPSELKEINIQVYFWLDPFTKPRISVPSLRGAGIFAWASKEDFVENSFSSYPGEKRLAPNSKLCSLRPMATLLGSVT